MSGLVKNAVLCILDGLCLGLSIVTCHEGIFTLLSQNIRIKVNDRLEAYHLYIQFEWKSEYNTTRSGLLDQFFLKITFCCALVFWILMIMLTYLKIYIYMKTLWHRLNISAWSSLEVHWNRDRYAWHYSEKLKKWPYHWFGVLLNIFRLSES